MTTNSQPVPLADVLHGALDDLRLAERVRDIIEVHGERGASLILGLSREATKALAGGLRTQAGTKALARAKLAEHDALEQKAAVG